MIRDGAIVKKDIVFQLNTLEEIYQMDVIQSADTVILVHETYNPMKLVRGSSDSDWTLSNITMTMPVYDFGSGDEPVWSDARGWPAVCTFHGGRLWVAGSTQKPTSVWASRVNSFFDFTWTETSGEIPDDHGIFDTIDTNEFNKITNIFIGRKLQVFTTAAEFINDIPFPTPKNSSWLQQTGYGSKRIRPILIDGATLYVDSSLRTIRQFIYEFNEDGYVSNNITLLASHLLSNIKTMTAIKGTSLDISDYVYVVNEDGTIAVLNTLRSENLLGWTHWVTQGEFVDACVLGKEVYFLVKRHGNYFIEKLEEDAYTDHHVINRGTKPTINNIVDGVNNIVDGSDNIVDTDTSSGTAVTSITTDYKDLFLTTPFKVVADYSILPDAMPVSDGTDLNHFDISREAYRLEIGLDFKTRVKLLPIHTTVKGGGNTFHRRKRVVKIDVNVYDSLGVYAREIYSADKQFTVVLDKAAEPFTGLKEVYTLGYSRITQFEITQENPLPMFLRAIGYEIAY